MGKSRKILFILIDQLRADCLNGALADHVKMPNIRALQKDAVTFTQHYSVTNPCGPARASIFTGKYAMNHRSVRNGAPLAHGTPNLPREMRKAGFDPLLFGYSDTSRDPRVYHPNDPVLKTEEELMPEFNPVVEMRLEESYPWRADLKAKGYDLPDRTRFYEPVSPDPDRAARPDDPTFYRAKDSDTAFLTNKFLEYISVRADQDWFGVVTYIRPHPPLVAPEPYNKMYNPADMPLPNRMQSPELENAAHVSMAAATKTPAMEALINGCDGQISSKRDADVRQMRALYFGLATELDNHVGRIIQFLKDTDQYDDTLIVLSADHGEMLGDHHLWGKLHVYDPCFRVPLIIRDPSNPQRHGASVDSFTESIDITPTLLDLSNRNVPKGMDGSSLRPFLQGSQMAGWKDCVHMELDFSEPNRRTPQQKATGLRDSQCNLAILREKQYKLVHFNGGLDPMLFDIENDPFEMNNLASDPQYSAELLRMTQKLLSHRMTHMDKTLSSIKNTSDGAVDFDRD